MGDYELQLGHGIFSVETLAVWARQQPYFMGFNWAAAFLPWKHDAIQRTIDDDQVLQLGHGVCPWKHTAAGYNDGDIWMLQLGHGIFSVETVDILS